MNGSQTIIKILKQANVKFIIGYTGGTILSFFDSIQKFSNIKLIMCRNEQGATFIAEGISRGSVYKNKKQLGVCVSTSGPGALNMVTGVADAQMDSVPLLAITGQVQSDLIGTGAFQESNLIGVMSPICKYSSIIKEPKVIQSKVLNAINNANQGRFGATHLDIPKDIFTANVSIKTKQTQKLGSTSMINISTNTINKAINLINLSDRPLIICGHGIVNSSSGIILEKLINIYNIPIVFTLLGLSSISASHKLSMGMRGVYGDYEANKTVSNADRIIALGVRFDDRVTGDSKKFAIQAKKIHVEIDKKELNKNVKVDLGINADVNAFLKMLFGSGNIMKKDRAKWLKQLEGFRCENFSISNKSLNRIKHKESKLLMKDVISQLSNITHGKDLIVTDVGIHQMFCARYYKFNRRYGFFTSGGLGTMGAGLPMAIGVKLVNPKSTVWCIVGDGGFQMNMQELGVLMEYKINLKIILLNNQFLGMIRQMQSLFYKNKYTLSPMMNPNYEQIAHAYKLKYQKVKNPEDINNAVQNAINCKESIITEFLCDPTELVLPMVKPGESIDNMINSITL